jgi:hypothetical protein
VRNTKTRIAKLESRNPKKPLVIHFLGFKRNRLLTPEEVAILKAEEERLVREAKTGVILMNWTAEEAQRLMLTTPPITRHDQDLI